MAVHEMRQNLYAKKNPVCSFQVATVLLDLRHGKPNEIYGDGGFGRTELNLMYPHKEERPTCHLILNPWNRLFQKWECREGDMIWEEWRLVETGPAPKGKIFERKISSTVCD